MTSQGGKVGITLNVNWGEPEDEANPEHLEASQRFMDFFLGWYANPIFVDGKYPEVKGSKLLWIAIHLLLVEAQ